MRQKRRIEQGYEVVSNIVSIRAVEDAIRGSSRYTEGIRTIRKRHPSPIQGEELVSPVFCKHYDVYPDLEISWDMPAGVAVDWLWGEYKWIGVMFKYDYRVNRASVMVRDGKEGMARLAKCIPGFGEAMERAAANGNRP